MSSSVADNTIAILPGFGVGPELVHELQLFYEEIRRIAECDLILKVLCFDENYDKFVVPESYCKQATEEILQQRSYGIRLFVLGPQPANVLSELRHNLGMVVKIQLIEKYSTMSKVLSPLKDDFLEKLNVSVYRLCVPSFYEQSSIDVLSPRPKNLGDESFINSQVRSACKMLRPLCPPDCSIVLAKCDYPLPGLSIIREGMSNYRIINPDTGLVEILLNSSINHVICMDLEGDLVGDLLECLVNGTKVIGYAVNYDLDKVAYYQTLHGEALDIAGQGVVLPVAFIRALATAMKSKPQYEHLARGLISACVAVSNQKDVLSIRTRDFFERMLVMLKNDGSLKDC